MFKSAIRQIFHAFGYDLHRRITRENVRVISEGVVVDFEYSGVNYRMFVSNTIDAIQRHHVGGKLYEAEELEIIARQFPPGGVFLDIGANVGNHTVFAAKALNARKVFAFEPASPQSDILAINVILNEVVDRVTIYRLGLSNTAGTSRIQMRSPLNIGGAGLSGGTDGESVTLSRGDDVLGDTHIDFIKIDVEGHEMAVLEGLQNVIRTKRPTIFAEVDNDNWKAFSECLDRNNYHVVDSFRRYAENNNYLVTPV